MPSVSTLLANDSCGTPSRSASIAASAPIRASVDSEPRMTRSKPDPAEHLGEHRRGHQAVRAVQRLVDDVHRLVGAHRQRLADRLGCLLRAHRQDRDLAAVRLLQPQAFLDRVLVELVDHRVGGVAVQRAVLGPQRALRPGVRHLLHQDDDVHDRRPTSNTNNSRPYGRLSLPKPPAVAAPGVLRALRQSCYSSVEIYSAPVPGRRSVDQPAASAVRSAASTTLASSMALVIGPDAARHRRQVAGHLGHRRVDVPDQPGLGPA